MCFFWTHPFWNETETLSNPKDMRIHWKRFSSEAEQKEAMDRFRTYSFQNPHGLLDILRIHFFQKGEAQLPSSLLDPMQDIMNALRFLLS